MKIPKEEFSQEEARKVGDALGIDWAKEGFTLEDFTEGMNVELEHGLIDPRTNCTNDDPIMTGKIALAHLYESDDYYEYLEKMEKKSEHKAEMKELKHEAEEVGIKIKAAEKLREKILGGMY